MAGVGGVRRCRGGGRFGAAGGDAEVEDCLGGGDVHRPGARVGGESEGESGFAGVCVVGAVELVDQVGG